MFSRAIHSFIKNPTIISRTITRSFKTGKLTDITFDDSAIQKLRELNQPLRIQVDAGGKNIINKVVMDSNTTLNSWKRTIKF
jgi:hypothetical protein